MHYPIVVLFDNILYLHVLMKSASLNWLFCITIMFNLSTPYNTIICNINSQLTAQELSCLYQETGAPIHSAYALPQLLALYKNNDETRRVKKWKTISSICIHRWIGGGDVDIPISFSEAR